MRIHELIEMRNRTPFRPFNLHFQSGAVLPVGHPEMVSAQPDAEVFTLWLDTRSWNLVDIESVERISLIQKRPK